MTSGHLPLLSTPVALADIIVQTAERETGVPSSAGDHG
jgi:hypothetical protein